MSQIGHLLLQICDLVGERFLDGFCNEVMWIHPLPIGYAENCEKEAGFLAGYCNYPMRGLP
jgi:hypothetical protein